MILPVQFMMRLVPERWRPRFHFITRNVPKHWWYLTSERRLWWFTGIADEMRDRPNVVRHEIQEGCFLETYLSHRIESDGSRECGPAVFLVVHGSEILKFDCFGYPAGHYHVATPYPYGIWKGLALRILLPEKTREEQVERAIFELRCNAHYYLQTHPRRKVRNTHLDEKLFVTACAEARSTMLDNAKRLVSQDAGACGNSAHAARPSAVPAA
jgi:hypothetical protein